MFNFCLVLKSLFSFLLIRRWINLPLVSYHAGFVTDAESKFLFIKRVFHFVFGRFGSKTDELSSGSRSGYCSRRRVKDLRVAAGGLRRPAATPAFPTVRAPRPASKANPSPKTTPSKAVESHHSSHWTSSPSTMAQVRIYFNSLH
jgi:hypothetical protein